MTAITDAIIFFMGSLSCFGMLSRFVDTHNFTVISWVSLYALGQLAWCLLCVLTYQPDILPAELEAPNEQ